jgi:hypothetical protein
MILKQQQTAVYGNPDIWQVLLEYEHAGKQPAAVSGYRVEWQLGRMADKVVAGKSIPFEVVLFSGGTRQVLDACSDTSAKRLKHERMLKSGVPLQHGELVQVRAKFPCRMPQAQAVLF